MQLKTPWPQRLRGFVSWGVAISQYLSRQRDAACTLAVRRLARVYFMNYTDAMYSVEQSETFSTWLHGLRDAMARIRVTARISVAKEGNLGDCESVGDGVHEMRVHVGPGYRLYFRHSGQRVIFLLLSGDKSSQSRDIKRAKAMAKEINEE